MANVRTASIAKNLVSVLSLFIRLSCSLTTDTIPRPIRLDVTSDDGSLVFVELRKNGSAYYFQPITHDGEPLPRIPTLDDPELLLAKIIEEQHAALHGYTLEGQEFDVPESEEHDENLEKKPGTETNIDTEELKGPSSPEQSFNQSSFKQTGQTFNMNENKGKNVDADAVKSPYGLTNDAGGGYFLKVSNEETETQFYSFPEYINRPSAAPGDFSEVSNEDTGNQFNLFPEYINSSSLNPKNKNTLGQFGSQPELMTSSEKDLNKQSGREMLPSKEVDTDNATGLAQDESNTDFTQEERNTAFSSSPDIPQLEVAFPGIADKSNPEPHNGNISEPSPSRSKTSFRTFGIRVEPHTNTNAKMYKVLRRMSIIKSSKRINIVFVSEVPYNNDVQTGRAGVPSPTLIKPDPYPDEPKENITCLSYETFLARKRFLSNVYHKTKSCPAEFPCKSYQSCSLWESGFVGDDFKFNNWITLSYLKELFRDLHPVKLASIKTAFKTCSAFKGKNVNLYRRAGSGPEQRTRFKGNSETIENEKSRSSVDCERTVRNIRECLINTQSKGICMNSDVPIVIEV